ncbi:MAG: hypothetical protein HXY34_03170 [Candidatus Thorarchaeota archaeon]|nr:hypothetical protein [Candidatus Thorarchaeota archaeon]
MRQDPSSQVCASCKATKATHMCEECGQLLCLDCLTTRSNEFYVCGNCHASLGTVQNAEKPRKCAECDSENISTGKHIEETCPQCHSTRVLEIEEKRRRLGQDMKRGFMSIQYGHVKLREFSNRLTMAKRMLVSLRMANFLAFRWLEDKTEKLQQELPGIKSRIVNQADTSARRMAAETKGLMNQSEWSVDQFPFIEGIVSRLADIGNQYRQSVDEALESCSRELTELTTQLEGLDYYRREFASFYEYSELQVNELPVCALPEIRIVGSDFLKTDKATGCLYVTNKRILFVAATGTIRKKREIVFDFPLLYLTSMGEDGRLRKRLVLKLRQGEIRIACDEHTQRVITDYIEIAKKFDKYVQSDLQRVRRLEKNDVGVSDARLKIEELVYSLLLPGRRQQQTKSTGGVHRDTLGTGSSDIYPAAGQVPRTSAAPPFATDSEEDMEPGRVYNRGGRWDGRDTPEIRRLRREHEEIGRALQDTVEDLKRGRVVTEEFIRRYRDLMRESYINRRMLEYLSRSSRDFA